MTDWIDESARMDGESMPNGTEINALKLTFLLSCCKNATPVLL